MKELNNITQADQEQLLGSIDDYQADIVKAFLKSTSNDYLKSADYWLNAGPANTAKFGGEPNKTKIYRDKLLEELETLQPETEETIIVSNDLSPFKEYLRYKLSNEHK